MVPVATTNSWATAKLPLQKKSQKEIKDDVRRQKALIKWEKKAALRKKTEKKLAEKAERKIAHKTTNAKRKLEKKLGIPSTLPPHPKKFADRK